MGAKQKFTDDELRAAMQQTGNRKSAAAKLLGVVPGTLTVRWQAILKKEKVRKQIRENTERLRAEGRLDVALKPPAGSKRPKSCKRPPPDDGSVALSDFEAARKGLIAKRQRKQERRQAKFDERDERAARADQKRKTVPSETELVQGITYSITGGPGSEFRLADMHFAHGARAAVALERVTPENWRAMYALAAGELVKALAMVPEAEAEAMEAMLEGEGED